MSMDDDHNGGLEHFDEAPLDSTHGNSGPGGPIQSTWHPTWCDLRQCTVDAHPGGQHGSTPTSITLDVTGETTALVQLFQALGDRPGVAVTFHDPRWNAEEHQDDDLTYGLAVNVERAWRLGHALTALAREAAQ